MSSDPLKIQDSIGLHQDSNSQSESSLGNVRVDSLTLSYIPKSMKCDSRASLLAHTFYKPLPWSRAQGYCCDKQHTYQTSKRCCNLQFTPCKKTLHLLN